MIVVVIVIVIDNIGILVRLSFGLSENSSIYEACSEIVMTLFQIDLRNCIVESDQVSALFVMSAKQNKRCLAYIPKLLVSLKTNPFV
jgi:hypothetical protein